MRPVHATERPVPAASQSRRGRGHRWGGWRTGGRDSASRGQTQAHAAATAAVAAAAAGGLGEWKGVGRGSVGPYVAVALRSLRTQSCMLVTNAICAERDMLRAGSGGGVDALHCLHAAVRVGLAAGAEPAAREGQAERGPAVSYSRQ